MPGVVTVFIIIFAITRYVRSQGPRDNTNPPNGSTDVTVWSLCFLMGFLMLMFNLFAEQYWLRIALNTLVITGCSMALFPRVFGRMAIYLGQVKAAYFFGRIAYSHHRNDLFAGGLVYAWRALFYIKQPRKKDAAEHWLRQKWQNYTGTLGSGAIVMHTLMQAQQLPYPELVAQSKLLAGLNKHWLPQTVSASAFRCLLARACQEQDFAEIRAQSRQWQLLGQNPFAQWVDMYHWSLGAKTIPWNLRIKIAWLYLTQGNRALKNYLPQLKAQQAPNQVELDSLEHLKHAELQHKTHKTASPAGLNDAWLAYCNTFMAEQWQPRLRELGCFNAEEVLARLHQSVRDLISLRSGEGDLTSEAAMKQREHLFTLLTIKITAMKNRSENNKMMSGVQELEEFLGIIRIASQVAKDPGTQAQVFMQMRNPVWNWIVELWNNKNDRPLAYFACSYMAPLAKQFGDTEATAFFSGIINQQLR